MSTPKPTLVEYIGASGHQWFDEEGTKHVLVAGRRYPASEALATYMVEHDSNHWKRPEPATKPIAAKE